MKKIILSLALMLFSILAAVSQNINWEKIYSHEGFAFNNPVMDILPLNDEGYLLAGTVFYNNAINHQFIRVIKTDTLGEVIWDKFLNMDDENFTLWQQANSIAATADGNFLICGVDHVYNSEEKAYFVKINSDGDTLWTKKFPFENTAKSLKMIPLGNDEFVFAGAATDSNFEHSALLGKIDGNGNLLWSSKYFTDEVVTEAWDLKQTKDNGFVLCGKYGSNVFITKTDANGLEEWSKVFEYDSYATGFSILQTSDNGFLVGGGHYDDDDLTTLILKTNAQGDSLWSKNLDDQNRFITSMHQNQNGSIGITTAAQGFYSGMFGGSGDFFKIDEDGNIEDHLALTGQGNAIEPLNNGCYLIGGSNSLPVDYNEYMYLAKIGDIVNSNEELHKERLAEIFPNPANQLLQIQLSEQQGDLDFELFDALGRTVLVHQLQNESTEISVSDFPNGLYFFTIKCNQKITQTGKVLIEH